jgi:hypothetical protein
MKGKIYISPGDLQGIKVVSEMGNSEPFLKYLDEVNYHFLLFSTLYQSGAKLFYVDFEHIPLKLQKHPFWKEKFIQIDETEYYSLKAKSVKILDKNFDRELDKKYNAPQYAYLADHLTTLFYSVKNNIPFLTTQFVNKNDFDFLESRMSKEFYNSIGNLYSLIKSDQVQTIYPQYSVMKKDIRRFEDIVNNSTFEEYNESLLLLEHEEKPEKLIKKIKGKSTKLYNKFSSSLELKDITFSLLKTNKKILDLFTNKATSIIGDFGIEFLEKIVNEKSKIHYYESKENYILRLWADRIGELWKAGGKEDLNKHFDQLK